MSSRIEQLMDEIEEYIEGCKYQPLSNSKIIVNKEEIEELLRELRMRTPDEIKRYQKIINNKEAILNDAREKAEALLNEATAHTNELINEHEIMQQAYAQANEVVKMATQQAQEILDNATIEANNVKASAIQYTDDILANLEGIIEHGMGIVNDHYGKFLDELAGCLKVVQSNRLELRPDELEEVASTPETTPPVPMKEGEKDKPKGGEEISLDIL